MKIYNCEYCEHLNENHNGKWMCTKHNKETSGDGCKDFSRLQFCNTCDYAKTMIYESGMIDCIDYRCMLQNNKLIYSDNNPMRIQNAKYPKCILGMYEEYKE